MNPDISESNPVVLHSVDTFSEAHPAFSPGGTRWLIFRFKEDLLEAGAISYIGKKLVINDQKMVDLITTGGLAT